jgi:hypothetical protein
MVYVGVQGAPPVSTCGDREAGIKMLTVVPSAPITSAKPYLSADGETQRFTLHVPALRHGSTGPDLSAGGTAVPFEQVFVAKPGDSVAHINSKLAQGLHLLLRCDTVHLFERPSPSDQIL